MFFAGCVSGPRISPEADGPDLDWGITPMPEFQKTEPFE